MSSTAAPADDLFPPPIAKIAPYLTLAVAVFVAYGNVYGNAFLYDDEALIVNNTFLQNWHSLRALFATSVFGGATISGSYYRPLQILIYLVIAQTAGLSLFTFHLLNVGLHAANAGLLYRLGGKLGFHRGACFFAVLLWAVHPVHVEAVTYMSGTADPLFAFFGLACLLSLLPDFAPRRFLVAILLLILACLSKEEAVTIPLLAMSCLFLLSDERFRAHTYIRTWPLWLIVIGYAVLHVVFLPRMGPHAPGLEVAAPVRASLLTSPFATFFATLPSYLEILFAPSHLHFERSFSADASLHWPVMLGLAMAALAVHQIILRQERRNLPLSWGLLWFLSAYALHTGILFKADKPLYEHWMYLPSAGLFLGIAETIAQKTAKLRAARYQKAVVAVVLAVALLLGAQTFRQNRIWHDADVFYADIFANGETSPHAHNNLGIVYARRGDYEKAVEQYRLAMQYSGDTVPEADYNYAVTLLTEPDGDARLPEIIKHLRRAVEIDPDYYAATKALANLYARTGNTAQAALYRDRADAIHAKFTPFEP